MPRTKPATGAIEETVIQKRIVSPEEQNDEAGNNRTDGGPRDLFEFAASIPAEQHNEYIMYVNRTAPERSEGFIGKLTLPFDEETIKNNYGGGTYRLMLKRGSEIVRGHTFKVVGEPITNVPATVIRTVGGEKQSDIVEAIKLLMQNNPQTFNAEILKKSFNDALDIHKSAAINSQTSMPQMITMLKEMGVIGAPPPAASAMPEWLRPFVAAAVPALLGLFTKVLEPKNMVDEFANAAAAMEKIKGLGGGGAQKPDYMGDLIRNGPGLLGKVSDILGEMRRATELRMQHQAQQPAGPIVVQANPSLHTPPQQVQPIMPAVHAQPAAQAIPMGGQVQQGAPTPEWVMGKVAEMIERNDDPAFVLDFLDENFPELVAAMRTMTMEFLKQQIEQTPQLVRVVTLPHFEDFLKKFHDKLHETATEILPN